MREENTNPSPPMYNLSPDDFAVLADPQTQALVEKHLADDPVQLALQLKGDREQARLICQQIKYLQRARSKLPSFYAARCIVPPLSYEQCSSEAAAALKTYAGALCIDLTCGLGVDAVHFSRSFGRVVAVERDPALAQVARHNFERLGAGNIAVENTSAEDFLAAYDGPEADLIYLDPARRRAGERVFKIEDCDPNVLKMREMLLRKAKRVLVKLSPLFDIEEARRLFAPNVSKVEIVSIGGEVKEVLVELERAPERTQMLVTLGDGRRFEALPDVPAGAEYLLAPDAAFYKARMAKPGFVFASEAPPGYPGRVYRVLEAIDFQPKKLKKRLKEAGIKRINILRKHFPHPTEAIKRMLGVAEGGTEWWAFTETRAFRVRPL